MLRVAETIQRTDTGLQRRGNEDSSYVRAPMFVVADGMGGAQAGEVASRIAVQTFEEGLPDVGSAEERLASRVHEANSRIYERSHAVRELDGMGTTVTAALLDDEHVAIAHVGDSRAYLFRDGELRRLTQDHSLVDELVRQGKLTEAQAAEHPQRSIITRALGPEATVEVDTWSYAARPGDVILLCSDGLTSMISEARIGEVLTGAPSLAQAGDQLIRDANAAGGRDNITVVLFRIEEVGSAGGLDQPTMIAPSPAAGTDHPTLAQPAADGSVDDESPWLPPTTAEATLPPVVPPPDLSTRRTDGRTGLAARMHRPRLARTQGPPAERAPKRRSERFIKPVSALIAVVLTIFLVGGGGYIATRQLYFIGTNSDGIVTVYRGLPYDVLGINLYETFYTSGVPAAVIPTDRRAAVFNHDLRSQSSATKLIKNLELGNVSK
jgi:serine/threonine protein phosphatase PrpC